MKTINKQEMFSSGKERGRDKSYFNNIVKWWLGCALVIVAFETFFVVVVFVFKYSNGFVCLAKCTI